MNCLCCGHPVNDHCKGRVSHSNYKEDSRMLAVVDRQLSRVCVGRHCEHPLCSCVELVEPEVAA